MIRVLALDFVLALSVDEEHSIHVAILVMREPFKGHRFLEKKVKGALTCEVLALSSCLHNFQLRFKVWRVQVIMEPIKTSITMPFNVNSNNVILNLAPSGISINPISEAHDSNVHYIFEKYNQF